MSCRTRAEFLRDQFVGNLAPDSPGDLVGLGMDGYTGALNHYLDKLGPAGRAYGVFNDVKSAVVGGAAGGQAYGGLTGSFIAAGTGLAVGVAFGPLAAASLGAAGGAMATILAAAAVGAVAQALYQEHYARQNAQPGECPYPDNPEDPENPEEPSDPSGPGGPPFDPNNPGGGSSGSFGGPGFIPPGPDPLNPPYDPLVIDLNGGGFDLTNAIGSTAKFDLNGDGFGETVGWVSAGTAFVIRDLNGDGKVNGPHEFIGSGEQDAFDALAELDTNQDGVVDAADAAFGQLRIWQDLNGDGVSDPGEITLLSDHGITGFGVGFQTVNQQIAGNVIARQGSTTTDGAVFTIGSAYFASDRLRSEWEPPAGFELDEETGYLPGLNGYGTVKDLDAAMTLDATLLEAVRDLVLASSDLSADAYRRAFEDVLVRWAGADQVGAGSRGLYVNAQHLAVVEAFYGNAFFSAFNGSSNPNSVQAGGVNRAYDTLLEVMLTRFTSQVAVSLYLQTGSEEAMAASPYLALAGASYSQGLEKHLGNILPTLLLVDHLAPTSGDGGLDYFAKVFSAFRGAEPQYFGHGAGYRDVIAEAFGSNHEGSFYADFAWAIHLADRVGVASEGNDVLWGEGGVLAGGGGSDTYGYIAGQNISIFEAEAFSTANNDRLLIGPGISPSDVIVRKVGDTVVLSFVGQDGSIRLYGQDGAFNGGIEQIIFNDGTVWSTADIRAAALSGAGTDGDDVIDGFYRSAEVIDGGRGNDILSGRSGSDTFIFGREYGSDRIVEKYHTYHTLIGSEPGVDTLAFQPDTSLADLTVHVSGLDLILVIADTGDRMTIWRGASGDTDYGVELFQFQGQTLTRAQIQALAEPRTVITRGEGDAPTVVLAAGDETVTGRAYHSDTYEYSRGDGFDIIRGEGLIGQDKDAVSFTDIASTEVRFWRTGETFQHLVIEILGTPAGQLVIYDQFRFVDLYAESSTIGSVRFSDDVVLTLDDIVARMLAEASTDGHDTLDGGPGDDRLEGGAGDDLLQGGQGADTYVWSVGDGHDTIRDTSGAWDGPDRLELHGVSPDEVVVRDGRPYGAPAGSMYLQLGSGGSVIILNQSSGAINEVIFDDGTRWDAAELVLKLSGGFGDQVTHAGTAGNDTLQGTDGRDVFDGGAGNDIMRGGRGSDLYLFGSGSGSDTIIDQGDAPWVSADALKLTDLTSADVEFGRRSDDLFIRVKATGETLTVSGHFSEFRGVTSYSIERLMFADGEVWTHEQINAVADILRGSAGDDVISGSWRDEVYDGGAGDDTLRDFGGNDTYIWRPGDGSDTIVEHYSGDDTIILPGVQRDDVEITRLHDDLILRVLSTGETITVEQHFRESSQGRQWAIETVAFDDGPLTLADIDAAAFFRGTDGDDVIAGTSGDDLIVGGGGDDSLLGGMGSDTYVWNLGDGSDRITDQGVRDDVDVLELGVSLSDVVLSRSHSDLLITILQTGEVITVVGQFWFYSPDLEGDPNADNGIEKIIFTDGELDREGIADAAGDEDTGGGPGDPGEDPVEIDGTDQDDWLLGNALDNIIRGYEGDDVIHGQDGDDLIEGGAGNDDLYGGEGSDTYIWAVGDGSDRIADYGEGASDIDRLVLDSVIAAEVSVEVDGPDLVVVIGSERITVAGQLAGLLDYWQDPGSPGLEQIVFSDETWDRSRIFTEALKAGGRTLLTGTEGDDIITGAGGDETLWGQDGDDTLNGGDGSDWLIGGAGDDVLIGGAGDDDLFGGAGSDTYFWNSGDGSDRIFDIVESDLDVDTLVLGAGVGPQDVTIHREGWSGAAIRIGTETIHVADQFAGWGLGLERIVFADSTIWTLADMRLNYLANAATSGDDVIEGFDSDDTLWGGTGDDELWGGSGSDTYLFNAGEGSVIIGDWGNSTDVDTLVLGGLNSTDYTLVRPDEFDDLVLSFTSGETITLLGVGGWSGHGDSVELISFADSVQITREQLLYSYFTSLATSGADRVVGFSGDDVLSGGAGADTFVFKGWGYGQDVISDFDVNADRIEIDWYGPFEDLLNHAFQDGADVLFEFMNGTIRLQNVSIEDLQQSNFVVEGWGDEPVTLQSDPGLQSLSWPATDSGRFTAPLPWWEGGDVDPIGSGRLFTDSRFSHAERGLEVRDGWPSTLPVLQDDAPLTFPAVPDGDPLTFPTEPAGSPQEVRPQTFPAIPDEGPGFVQLPLHYGDHRWRGEAERVLEDRDRWSSERPLSEDGDEALTFPTEPADDPLTFPLAPSVGAETADQPVIPELSRAEHGEAEPMTFPVLPIEHALSEAGLDLGAADWAFTPGSIGDQFIDLSGIGRFDGWPEPQVLLSDLSNWRLSSQQVSEPDLALLTPLLPEPVRDHWDML